ncbi:MAG: beta-lactamase family protein [Rhodospirillaceae bacterium]|nr:beta-lactamase family protein [Rhodospirillaceae bacterium]
MLRNVFLAAVIAVFTLPASADDRLSGLPKVVEGIRQELGTPGLSIAVALNDKMVYAAGFGLADVENEVPARGDTVYRIASISKTFGATAILQLADRKKLKVDDLISATVPSFPHRVTLRQIMAHSSGIRHYKPGESGSMTRFDTLEDAIKIFKDDPLLFPPNTKNQYSSYAFNLLQGPIEKLSGQPLETYLIENIFKPAGLTGTSLEYGERIVPHRARAYDRAKDGTLQNSPYVDNSIKWLGGGLISSAEDLIRYNIALNQGKLVSAEALKLMNTANKLNDGTVTEYSLGWELSDDRGNHYVDKYGSGTGVSTYLLRIPEKHYAVAVLINLSHGNIKPFAKRISDAILASTGDGKPAN